MTTTSKTKARTAGPAAAAGLNLNDLLISLKSHTDLSETRLRDLRSSIKRVALLVGNDPAGIPFDLPAVSAKLALVNPVAAGLTAKSFSNIRSNFITAVKASGLKSINRSAGTPLSPEWRRLMRKLSGRRAHLGLSRLARFASAKGIEPAQVDDAVIEAFITAVRSGTLHRKPNELHRKVAQIWNEAVERSGLDLQAVRVPSFQSPAKRLDWTLLGRAFRKDADLFLTWCAGTDVFAANARPRPLAPRTVKLRRDQIHAAVTALVESGVKMSTIKSLAALVTTENFKRILRRRHEMVGGRENIFNHDLAVSLLQIAREWVKVDPGVLAELRRLARKVPTPPSGLTDKNKRVLRQFDDPAVLRRLYKFSTSAWAEVKRYPEPNRQTLVKAQVALAVAILCYMPLRPQNLATLAFGEHLFVHEARGATSSLEFAASEVKNRRELAFDIPPHLTKMLIEYRNRIAPKVIGRRPDKLFVKADGNPKNQWAVAWLIRTYLRKRAGITLSPHQFRHLSAKVVLDDQPGGFETARQLLGHKSLNTTVNAYAGIDSRRAARHHQRLVEQALAPETTRRQRTSDTLSEKGLSR